MRKSEFFSLQAKQRLRLQRWRGGFLLLRDWSQHGQPDGGFVQPHTYLPHHGRPSAHLPPAAERRVPLWVRRRERFTEPHLVAAQSVGSLHTLPHPHWPCLPGNAHTHTPRTTRVEKVLIHDVNAAAVPIIRFRFRDQQVKPRKKICSSIDAGG